MVIYTPNYSYEFNLFLMILKKPEIKSILNNLNFDFKSFLNFKIIEILSRLDPIY